MIQFQLHTYFFNSKKVLSATDKATRKVLSKFGAYVRQTARRSIRKRKKVADPGNPPTNRTGLLRNFIFFSYDLLHKEVVIGPARFSGKNLGDAPENLEYGKRGYKARPFMHPAAEKEQTKLPVLWRDSIANS